MQVDTEENEIGLIDILTVFAENLKILILGPVVVGLLTLGVGYALPQSFISRAILAPSLSSITSTIRTPAEAQAAAAQAAVVMMSPLVLDPVIKALNLSKGRPIEVARSGLSRQVIATPGKDGLLRLEVTANTPRDAQTIANAILDAWLKSTGPGERDRAELEKRLAYAKASVASIRGLMDRLAVEGSANLNKPLTRGEAGTSIITLGELEARYFAEVIGITKSLQGLSKEVVMQEPTLPHEPSAPKKSSMSIAAALATAFILALWVFVLHAWRGLAKMPEMAAKQAKLLTALGFKRRRG